MTGEQQALLNYCYPIGSIYETTSAENPSIMFGGGQWKKIEGRFLLGSGNTAAMANSTFYWGKVSHSDFPVKETAGSSQFSVSSNTDGHTIIQEELPDRTIFSYDMSNSNTSSGSGIPWQQVNKASYVATCNQDAISQWNVQSQMGQPHTHTFSISNLNYLPPYYCVNIWERIA